MRERALCETPPAAKDMIHRARGQEESGGGDAQDYARDMRCENGAASFLPSFLPSPFLLIRSFAELGTLFHFRR